MTVTVSVYGLDCNICTVVNMTTRDIEHITMWDVPVCEGQCVLRRPWDGV